jgi:hypothetical protein
MHAEQAGSADSKCNAIPLKQRTRDDQEKAKLGKIARAKPKGKLRK